MKIAVSQFSRRGIFRSIAKSDWYWECCPPEMLLVLPTFRFIAGHLRFEIYDELKELFR